MTAKGANIFKGVILAFGLAVYAAAIALATHGRGVPPQEAYLWAIVGVVYLAFFIPALFNSLTFKSFAHSAAGVVILWNADIVFCFVSIALALSVYFGKVPVTLAIIVELVLIFVALILVFISMMSSSHIKGVGIKEAILLSKIKEMRSSLDSLNVKAQSASISEEIKSKIASLAEDAKYMSPVDSAQSASLEGDIIGAIDEAANRLDEVLSGASESALQKCTADLAMKMAQRKLLKN